MCFQISLWNADCPERLCIKLLRANECRDVLDELRIPYQHGIAGTGIIASIGQGNPSFSLRADMDALPIEEETEDSWKSRHPGKCHCCSHDSHMAMLLSGIAFLWEACSDLS